MICSILLNQWRNENFMDLSRIINEKKRKLTHNSHGGEIYKINTLHDLNSLLDFSININPLAPLDLFKRAYLDSINQISRYPDSKSTLLKEQLVKYFENKITAENLIIGAGSEELISIFCSMFIDSGDEVIIYQPTFTEYAWAIQKNEGKIINVYRKSKNNFQLECDPIISQITSKTKIIFICNPNNPNGLLDPLEKLEEIIKIASENDILVFLDEAFIEFTGESNSFVNKIALFDNLFVCRSFTKFFGIPGLRIGFGVSNANIINYITNGQVLWPVNCVAQRVAQEILKSKEFIDKSLNFFSEESKFVVSELKKIKGLKVYPTNTNYILINTRKTGVKASNIKECLLEEKILIRDCSNYEGLNGYYIRICIKSRELNLKLISSLKKIFRPQMHEKGLILINKVMREKKLTGIDQKCDYYPCHTGLEDCTFCYCPFYPCYQTDTGGFEKIYSKTGGFIWACSSCIFPHKKENAKKILNGLIELGQDFESISKEKLMKLRTDILIQNGTKDEM